MIKLIENFEDYDFSDFDDVFFGRIYSDYMTLSCFQTVSFYVCVNDNEISAVISKVDGNVTFSAKGNAPFDEISEFLNVTGYVKVLCESKYSEHFYGKKTSGSVLKYVSDKIYACKAKELYTEDLKQVYPLLSKTFSLSVPFADWFADLSHKMRHFGARVFGIDNNDVCISVAFSLFETKSSAVLSSVATDEFFRKSGYGRDVVKKVLSENAGKNVYVFTENEEIEKWYNKFGFKSYKLWSEIENVL